MTSASSDAAPSETLSRFLFFPLDLEPEDVIDTRGGVPNPNDFATLVRSSALISYIFLFEYAL